MVLKKNRTLKKDAKTSRQPNLKLFLRINGKIHNLLQQNLLHQLKTKRLSLQNPERNPKTEKNNLPLTMQLKTRSAHHHLTVGEMDQKKNKINTVQKNNTSLKQLYLRRLTALLIICISFIYYHGSSRTRLQKEKYRQE